MFLITALNQLVEREYGEHLISRPRLHVFLKIFCMLRCTLHILSPTFLSRTLRITSSHFLIYAHSETHGRSCKKIKEKAIRSVGGSFSCRSRSMAHEVADTYTHTHMCTQHTCADCVLDSQLYFFVCDFLFFFYLFIFFLLNCRT